jgi:drug/metabolite transporter (DMT)-like permease
MLAGEVAGLWLANLCCDVGGQLAFKVAATRSTAPGELARWRQRLSAPWLWIGIASYAACITAWAALLSLIPLSTAMLLGCLNLVALPLASAALLGERPRPREIAGMGLVALGVAVVGLAS